MIDILLILNGQKLGWGIVDWSEGVIVFFTSFPIFFIVQVGLVDLGAGIITDIIDSLVIGTLAEGIGVVLGLVEVVLVVFCGFDTMLETKILEFESIFGQNFSGLSIVSL